MIDPVTRYCRRQKQIRYDSLKDNFSDLTGQLRTDTVDSCTVTSVWNQSYGAPTPPAAGAKPLQVVKDRGLFLTPGTADAQVHYGGTTLFGGYFINHWGHFLTDNISRLWPLFDGSGTRVDRIVFFKHYLDVGELRGNFALFVEYAGLKDKIVICDAKTASFERLVIPDRSFDTGAANYAREHRLVFDKIVNRVLGNEDVQQTGGKVFLTRSAFNDREINVDLIDDFFGDNGYDIVAPERLALDEMIRLFARCDEVVSYSGTASHNFLFAPNPDTRFVVLERSPSLNPYEFAVIQLTDGQTELIDACYIPKFVEPTGRIHLYQFTEQFRRFIADRGLQLNYIDSDKRKLREVRRFVRLYHKKHLHRGAGVSADETEDGNAYVEAWVDTQARYAPWLNDTYPLLRGDWFNLYRMGKSLYLWWVHRRNRRAWR